MTEKHWRSLQELAALQEGMSARLDRDRERCGSEDAAPVPWLPATDIAEDAAAIVICMELPGLDQGEIDVQIEEQTLIVRGVRSDEEREGLHYHRVERLRGPFRRSFALPANIDQAQVRAQCERGVLQVILPKSQASGVRLIEVEIQKLPARQREAFMLRYWEELDTAETASVMGCSEGSVKTHCSRAVHALAKALTAKGIQR